MKLPHGAAVALLVVLAGCGGFLGAGNTATPQSTTQPGVVMSTPTPTVSPTTPPTPTATATPTPVPDSYATRTVTNESLRTRFDLVGNRGVLRSFLQVDVTGIPITQGAVLECARTTPFVAVSTNQSVADVTATMEYNPDLLPPNATESELSVFVFNRTVEFYLEMETTVDTANNTATGTQVKSGQTFVRETDNGTERVTPKLDGTRLDNAFVVMHAPTWWEAVETREIPSQCTSGTPTATQSDATATETPN
ncbi:MAG: hypothetical protein V5A44_05395 [Haloarculaceae archaeon]